MPDMLDILRHARCVMGCVAPRNLTLGHTAEVRNLP